MATSNPGKVRELRRLLADADVTVVTPADLGISLDVDETGDTYEENAALKAIAFAQASGLPSLADDSGLEVEALSGAPGVHSARYAGTGSDKDNVDLLLHNLASVHEGDRTARFVCVVALALPSGAIEYARGQCEGTIGTESRGDRGFGYDPVFYPEGRTLTMAQLHPDEKDRLSHRGRAVRNALPVIDRLLED